MENEEYPYRKVLGARIRAIRLEQGITQDQLALMIGNSSNGANISRIEQGKLNVKADTIYRIAEALGVKMSTLLGDL